MQYLCSNQLYNLFLISDAEQESRNIIEECAADYEACGYSPVYISPNSVELGTLVVSEIDDEKRLTFARLQVQGTGTRIEVSLSHTINIQVSISYVVWKKHGNNINSILQNT